MVIFPWIQLLRRALNRTAAAELGARFLPMEGNYPALARWIARIESLPGYARTIRRTGAMPRRLRPCRHLQRSRRR